MINFGIHQRIKADGKGYVYDKQPRRLLCVFRNFVEAIYNGGYHWEEGEYKTVSKGRGEGSDLAEVTYTHDMPMTIAAFLSFANITNPSWESYKNIPELGLQDACELIVETINDDWLTGAAVGAFNAAVVKFAGIREREDNPTINVKVEPITGMNIL